MSRMRFIRIMPTTTASAIGNAPPDRLVPAPRGMTRTPCCVAEAQHGGDLLGGLGQHHGQRRLAVGGQPVRLVGFQAQRLGDDAVGGHQRAQPGDDLVAPGEDIGLRFGLADHPTHSLKRHAHGRDG